MVGIAIVSHSAKLAEGVRDLAKQMVQAPVRIAIAAGIDDPENPYGTDVIKVVEAISSVFEEQGVIVLMDLGSSILSAEMAIELLPEAMQQKVKLCPAPLVEGAIAAAVQAAAGADIATIISEAQTSIIAKASHLSQDTEKISPTRAIIAATESEKRQEIQLQIKNKFGLHARPAAKLVNTASKFSSAITVQNLTKNSSAVNAKSINQIITLGVKQNDRIAIVATGEDAKAAIKALQELVNEGFGETEIDPVENKSIQESYARKTKIKAIPASPGLAIGSIVSYQPTIPEIKQKTTDNPQGEWERLQLAISTVKQEIDKQIQSNKVEIFEAHLLILKDPILLDLAKKFIFEQKNSAASSWQKAIASIIDTYKSLSDSYLRDRAVDVQDVGTRVLRSITGTRAISLDFSQPGIIVAPDLTPSEVSQLNTKQVLGICLAGGSPTAHSALLANMKGIPAIVGAGAEILSLKPNTQLAFDGSTGEIWIEPTPQKLQELNLRIEIKNQEKSTSVEPVTKDGFEVPLMANIAGIADGEYALKCGAKGIGLLRTEFLYLDNPRPPSEAEQLEVYRSLAQMMGTRPLIIRTVDIGGDKPVSYLKIEPENNPFLGWRGIRQSIECRQMLKTQLRAILQASCGAKIQIMLPMVSSLEEVRAAKEILGLAMEELKSEAIDFQPNIPVGITIEVPAAVMMASRLAKEVDFFSIGTNDLSQYIMAADRTNPKVASLADALAPPVLLAIQQTVIAAQANKIRVAVCGQIASDPIAVPILLGLGVEELSVNPPAIATVAKTIAQFSMAEFRAIADAVLQLDSARAVREYIATSRSIVKNKTETIEF